MKSTKQRLFLLLVIISPFIFLSCDKDDDDESPKSRTELLTSGTWKRTALTSNPAYDWNADGNAATDVLSIMLPCERDNFDTYKPNGIMETNEGASKCDPSDPQTWQTTWALVDNERQIRYDDTYNYTIVELTEITLKLRTTFEENGVTYTHDETYSH